MPDEIKIEVLHGEHAGRHTFRDAATFYGWLRMYDIGKSDYVYA